MKKSCLVLVLSVIGMAFGLTPADAIDINNTKLLSQPAIGGDHIAFVYANDLWVADLN